MESAFERAQGRISWQLRDRSIRFNRILNGQKVPIGKDWTTRNYAYDAPELIGYLAEGHNYGICTGIGNLVVLDVDEPPHLQGVIDQLPETFTVRTGSGGSHYYLFCSGFERRIVLYHPSLLGYDGKPLHLGEIQAHGQQVVGPGSIHPNGKRYKVTADLPIATIDKASLIDLIVSCPPHEDEKVVPRSVRSKRKRRSFNRYGLRIEDIAWPNGIVVQSGDEISGSHPIHSSTTGRNFAINPRFNCWHCFRCNSGGGPLEWRAVQKGLIDCRDAKPGCLDKEVT